MPLFIFVDCEDRSFIIDTDVTDVVQVDGWSVSAWKSLNVSDFFGKTYLGFKKMKLSAVNVVSIFKRINYVSPRSTLTWKVHFFVSHVIMRRNCLLNWWIYHFVVSIIFKTNHLEAYLLFIPQFITFLPRKTRTQVLLPLEMTLLVI